MENNTGINKQQFDGLNELMEMGLNSSAEILSKLLNNEVELGTEELNQESANSLDSFGDMPGVFVGLNLSGEINGKAAVLVQNAYIKEILSVLMNNDDGDDGDDELNEISLGTFKELAGQMAAAFADTLTNFLGSGVKIQAADIVEMSEDFDEISDFFGCDEDDELYSLTNSFLIKDILSGNFVILNDETAMSHIINRIMGDTEEQSGGFNSFTPGSAAQRPGQPMSIVRDGSINVQSASFPSFARNGSIGGIPLLQGNMDLLMDVPLNVTIEIGKTRKKMRDIMEFAQGTIIDLEKQAGAPVDIVVNGQLIARGDVVVIDDNFGVRITEIIGSNNILEKK